MAHQIEVFPHVLAAHHEHKQSLHLPRRHKSNRRGTLPFRTLRNNGKTCHPLCIQDLLHTKLHYRTPPRKSHEHPSAYHHGHTPSCPISKRNETRLGNFEQWDRRFDCNNDRRLHSRRRSVFDMHSSHMTLRRLPVPSGDSGSGTGSGTTPPEG